MTEHTHNVLKSIKDDDIIKHIEKIEKKRMSLMKKILNHYAPKSFRIAKGGKKSGWR